jgi:hypothetical protein
MACLPPFWWHLPYISLAFLFALLSLRLIRRDPDAALIDFSWWRRLFGSSGAATAQQIV